MALTDKLRDLDQRLLPGTRNDGEDAETYLRRVAASRAISPAQAGDVMAALRVYFGIEPGEDEGGADEGGEQKDEAGESGGGEKDQAEDGASESDESDEKSDDES